MADERLFKGIQQVTKTYFDSLQDEDKIGVLWFVRDIDEHDVVKSLSIYFGTRRYGHYGYEDQSIHEINQVLLAIRDDIEELYREIEEITGGLQLEEATTETIAEGHIEFRRNSDGELYGLMYYQE